MDLVRRMESSNICRESSLHPNLPPEIITEILLKLPVRSLLKFKCVCKSWLISISSSRFIKTHLGISTKSSNYDVILVSTAIPKTLYICSLSSLLCDTAMENSRAFDFPTSVSDDVWFVGSCHGLLCISVDPHTLVLYNPSIRKFKTLPVPGIDKEASTYLFYGFCYDDISDDYKVVELNTVRNQESMYSTKVIIYSLRNDSWRKIDSNHDGLISSCCGGQSVGGILHWCMCSNDGAYQIFAVNTVTNMYDTMEPPKDVGKYGMEEWSLGESNGCLTVFCDYYKTQLDVWAIKEYGVNGSWSKLASIFYPDNPSGHFLPLFVLKNDEFYLEYGPYMIVFNSRDDSFTAHHIESIGGQCSVAAPLYIESLVDPSFLGEEREFVQS